MSRDRHASTLRYQGRRDPGLPELGRYKRIAQLEAELLSPRSGVVGHVMPTMPLAAGLRDHDRCLTSAKMSGRVADRDVVEVAEFVQCPGDWLESDQDNLAISLARFAGSPVRGARHAARRPCPVQVPPRRHRQRGRVHSGPAMSGSRKAGAGAWPGIGTVTRKSGAGCPGGRNLSARERFIHQRDDRRAAQYPRGRPGTPAHLQGRGWRPVRRSAPLFLMAAASTMTAASAGDAAPQATLIPSSAPATLERAHLLFKRLNELIK